jgi:tetratricopeptide (TPR) repeat protein
MNRIGRLMVACAVAAGAGGLGGCASRHAGTDPAATAHSLNHSAPDLAALPLDQIPPIPVMPRAAAVSSAPAPLDALVLYAQARSAMLDGQRFTAIGLLQRALKLDPNSFELYMAMAQAQQGSSTGNDQAIAALEKAAALRPNDLGVQAGLGRQYLAKGDLTRALSHLRLARQTPSYAKDHDDEAALVDLLLARTLQQKGYDRAALDAYQALLQRLQHPNLAMRTNAELMFLANRPEMLFVDVARLHEKRGEYEQALQAYEGALEHDPDDLDLNAKRVRTLVKLGRDREAADRAVELVRQFRASPESLALLNGVYQRLGRPNEVIAELRRLHRETPEDRGLLFALAEALRTNGKSNEAATLLQSVAAAHPGDLAIVQRLFALYSSDHQVDQAARLLVQWTARRPEALRQLAPLWQELLRPGRPDRLRLAQLQALDVSPDAQAAKLYWVARVAELGQRDSIARSALEQAAELPRAFAPAYRALLGRYWFSEDWTDAKKAAASDKLAAAAQATGDVALAAELRGISLYRQKNLAGAAEALSQAMKLGDDAPDVQLMYATVLHARHEDDKFERLLWKLASDHPSYEDAWESLFRFNMEKGAVNPALGVLNKWLAADPTSVSARLVQASVFLQADRPASAEKVLQQLLHEQEDNADVLALLQVLYKQTGHLDQYITTLQDLRARHPDNLAVVDRLLDIYGEAKKPAEAVRVLDETRSAVNSDPESLYYLSHLYLRVDQKQSSQDVLQQALRLDPAYAPANNDLGYFWAEEGRNLPQAEALISAAVKAEPKNPSFLDSMGWVLYKRGRFGAAVKYLETAVGMGGRPDPVVLDHYGDTLYRLAKKPEAARQWRRALDRLEQLNADRDDLRALRGQLQEKLAQSERDQPVNVAPVPESAPAPPARARAAAEGE